MTTLNTAAEMTCQELVELVTDYLEGALPPGDRTRFEEHLTACAHCVTYIDQMRATIVALGRLRGAQLSDEASTELLAAFRDWKRSG